jgi:hypothetical protein
MSYVDKQLDISGAVARFAAVDITFFIGGNRPVSATCCYRGIYESTTVKECIPSGARSGDTDAGIAGYHAACVLADR